MAVARIYKPARTAMQSGTAKTKEWLLEFEPEQAREVGVFMHRHIVGACCEQRPFRLGNLCEPNASRDPTLALPRVVVFDASNERRLRHATFLCACDEDNAAQRNWSMVPASE